jgi:hypothetical protein
VIEEKAANRLRPLITVDRQSTSDEGVPGKRRGDLRRGPSLPGDRLMLQKLSGFALIAVFNFLDESNVCSDRFPRFAGGSL